METLYHCQPPPPTTTNHPRHPIFHFVVKTKAPLIVFPVFTILTVWSWSYGGPRKIYLDITNFYNYIWELFIKKYILKSVPGRGRLTDGIRSLWWGSSEGKIVNILLSERSLHALLMSLKLENFGTENWEINKSGLAVTEISPQPQGRRKPCKSIKTNQDCLFF